MKQFFFGAVPIAKYHTSHLTPHTSHLTIITHTLHVNTMKYRNGQLTFDFKRADSLFPFLLFICFVMFSDNFLYVGQTVQTDHKISFVAAGLFTYAFLHLLHHFFPSESAVNKPKNVKEDKEDELPDKLFSHEDEVSRVELTIKKVWKKAHREDRETDEEYDDDECITPSVSKRKTRHSETSSSSSSSPSRRKDKIQEKTHIKFKSWSKHPDKWDWKYWFSWFGFEASRKEMLKANDSYEF